MTQEEILLTLKRIVANLQLIHDSAALEEIANAELMTSAGDALHYCTQFKLRFNQALDAHIEQELNGIFEEAA